MAVRFFLPIVTILLVRFLLCSSVTYSQKRLKIDDLKLIKQQIDTMYLPVTDGVQLVIIDLFDTWQSIVDYKKMSQPRGMSWSNLLGPKPQNLYLWRNTKGVIINSYHTDGGNISNLKPFGYTNASFDDLKKLRHYKQFFGNFLIQNNIGRIGLCDVKGTLQIPMEFDYIQKYQGDKLVIVKNGKFGFVDKHLKTIFPPLYYTDTSTITYNVTQPTTVFSSNPWHNIIREKYIKVFKDGKCGLIDMNGKAVIDFKYDYIQELHDGLIVAHIYSKEKNKSKNQHPISVQAVVFNKNFKKITKLEDYTSIQYFDIKKFIVKKNEKFGLLHYNGTPITPLQYQSLTPENSGLVVVKDSLTGFISKDGKELLPCAFNGGIYFYDKAIYVTHNGLIGVYNTQYKLIAKPQFVSLRWEMGKFILTNKDGFKAFVNHNNNEQYYQSIDGKKVKL